MSAIGKGDFVPLTAELARALLRYEPETGRLFWLRRDRAAFSCDWSWRTWNARYAAREALSNLRKNGYRQGYLLGRQLLAHRVIWLLQTGAWPAAQIDHVNGVKSDNRWENLRETTNAGNMRNRSRRSDNVSGVNGVYWHAGAKKWAAKIEVSGAHRHLGLFDSREAAAEARVRANAEFGFSARHGEPVSGREVIASTENSVRSTET